MPVAGKVVLITGAAHGLAFEYARAFGAAGAFVVAGDVADCTAAVAPADDGAIGVRLDVTDMASTEAMAAATVKAFGRIDALVSLHNRQSTPDNWVRSPCGRCG
jgi:NAD(P)-dependent dehydrogenase (short-subunit alcohol dehydrogenase family)